MELNGLSMMILLFSMFPCIVTNRASSTHVAHSEACCLAEMDLGLDSGSFPRSLNYLVLKTTSSVNIPWPEKGMGDADYIHAFQKVIMPIALEFAPELVISVFYALAQLIHQDQSFVVPVSAGFDAAAGDELGECFVTPAGYAHMTHMLSGLAGGRLVVALEVSFYFHISFAFVDINHLGRLQS